MSEAVAEQIGKMSLGKLYISEKRGDDDTGEGSAERPFRTALRAWRDCSEPLPELMVDAQEAGEMQESLSKVDDLSESVLLKLDQHLLTNSYLDGYAASHSDRTAHKALCPHQHTFSQYTNLQRWFNHMTHVLHDATNILSSSLDVFTVFGLPGAQPYEPMKKAQVKKMTKLWAQEQRKKEASRKKEEQDAKNRAEQLEKAKLVVVTEDASLPAAVLAARLCDMAALRGQRVKARGWVQHLRRQGQGMMFVTLRDGYGALQCLLQGDLCKTVAALTLNTEACVAVSGSLLEVPQGQTAPGGHELKADYWELLSNAPPGGLEANINKDSHPDVQLDQRHLLIRGEHASKVLKLRSILKEAFVAHYAARHYRWVDPPAIVNAPCEGGSELFDLNYFGSKATLTQSSQLYLETCLPSMGAVYCMEKSFRAEPSRTRRHLAEYLHVEAEAAFIDFEGLLDMLEDLVVDVVERVLAQPEGAALVRALNPAFAPPTRPFRRMAYKDAIAYLDQHNIRKDDGAKYEFGEDIPEKPERAMTDAINTPILLHSFPAPIKAFYMQPHPTEPGLTESVDLLMPGVGEIVGGSMRMHDYDTLMAAFSKEGLPTEPYQWYIDQRKFGTVPHGGYGLGLERFLCWLSNTHHIRDACLYPRFVGRAYP